MGYYVSTLGMDLFVPRENFDAAYKAVCELNDHNELKGGGSWPGVPDAPEVGPRPDKWFSWMPWNYNEICKNLTEVMREARFNVTETDEGLRINFFDGEKAGDEDKFLLALAPFYDYFKGVPFAEWQGEEGERWRIEYHQDGTFKELTGKTVWV